MSAPELKSLLPGWCQSRPKSPSSPCSLRSSALPKDEFPKHYPDYATPQLTLFNTPLGLLEKVSRTAFRALWVRSHQVSISSPVVDPYSLLHVTSWWHLLHKVTHNSMSRIHAITPMAISTKTILFPVASGILTQFKYHLFRRSPNTCAEKLFPKHHFKHRGEGTSPLFAAPGVLRPHPTHRSKYRAPPAATDPQHRSRGVSPHRQNLESSWVKCWGVHLLFHNQTPE